MKETQFQHGKLNIEYCWRNFCYLSWVRITGYYNLCKVVQKSSNLPIVSSWSRRRAVGASPSDFPFLRCDQLWPAPGPAPDSWEITTQYSQGGHSRHWRLWSRGANSGKGITKRHGLSQPKKLLGSCFSRPENKAPLHCTVWVQIIDNRGGSLLVTVHNVTQLFPMSSLGSAHACCIRWYTHWRSSFKVAFI